MDDAYWIGLMELMLRGQGRDDVRVARLDRVVVTDISRARAPAATEGERDAQWGGASSRAKLEALLTDPDGTHEKWCQMIIVQDNTYSWVLEKLYIGHDRYAATWAQN